MLGKDPGVGNSSTLLTGGFVGKTVRTNRRVMRVSYTGISITPYANYVRYKCRKRYDLGSRVSGVHRRVLDSSVLIFMAPLCCCKVSTRLGVVVSEFYSEGFSVRRGRVGSTLLAMTCGTSS